MLPPPVVLLDETARRPVILRPTGDRGAESLMALMDGRPDEVALLPVQGVAYPPEAGKKLRALVAMKIDFAKTGIAAPTAVLRDPKNNLRDAPVHGFVCPKVTCGGLNGLTSPSERLRLKIDPWEQGERTAAAVGLIKMFQTAERLGLSKVDHNLPNWRYDPATGKFYSIDPLSLAFEHRGWHGTGVARPEMVAPEFQRKLAAGTLAAERIGVENERFALAVLLFLLFCDAFPTDYAGAEEDAVERKEFACVSPPAGARVPPEIEVAFFGLQPGLQSLIAQGLMNVPSQRPAPDKYLAELRDALPPRPPKPRPPWRFPFDRRKTAMAACAVLTVGWMAIKPPTPPREVQRIVADTPAAPRPLREAHMPAPQPPEKLAPRRPVDPDIWKTFGKKVGGK